MALYGILKSITNTGLDSELEYVFSTPLAVINNQPAYVQDMMNLKRKASSQNIQRWEIEATIAESSNSPNFLVHSAINGYSEIMYIRMPQVANLKTTTAAATVSAAVAAGNNTFNVNGVAALVVGEFVQFSNDSKVYLVVAGGAGGVGVKVFPALRIAIVAGSTIKTGEKVSMYARYDDNTRLGINYVDGVLSSQGSVKFIEAL